jgi:hypothetical protein
LKIAGIFERSREAPYMLFLPCLTDLTRHGLHLLVIAVF